MGKGKKRTTTTIGVMILFAIIILTFYYYMVNRTDPITDTSSVENLTEFEKIIQMDFENYYPETPREVTKTFARIMKKIYNDSTDDEIKQLAIKIRELYDEELLENNPEDTYLNNLYTEVATWKEKDRKITNYLLVNKDQEQQKEIDGIKYAVNYVSYTIQENSKFKETWKVLLRQDESKKWKILGWEYAPKEDE